LNLGPLAETWIAVPPKVEQMSVARFVDRETAKIDALVTEQERLIELLQEKRQAVISHAATKGLNPDAPMKPSSVEWLGDVPAHWAVARLKNLASSVNAGPFGSSLTKDMYVESGYRVYGQEQVIPNDFSVGDYFVSQEKYDELIQYRVAPGDILISCVGTFGKVALVPEGIDPGIINPRLIRLRSGPLITSDYLVQLLRSQVVFEQFASVTRGGTMDVINVGTVKEIVLPVPSLKEQGELLTFMKGELNSASQLESEIKAGVQLLRERRSALISAAVTGQIDVRGLVEQEAA
jgi:type I restriction enzyme S subunit